MALPQLIVVALLLGWGDIAAVVAVVLLAQLALMRRLLADPRRLAACYAAPGVSLYVAGMITTALVLRGMV
jgi:chlorophyll/bacteriochlorophyll a synthase